MALLRHQHINQHTSFALWRIEEGEQFFLERLQLTEEDWQRIASIKAHRRYLEWLASRYLLRYLLQPETPVRLVYKANNRPELPDFPYHISISHSKDIVAVIVSGNLTVGIDVEYIHPKVKRVADKFMSDKEMEQVPSNAQTESLILYWSAKETLFKLYGDGELAFKEYLRIDEIEGKQKGKLRGRIRVDQEYVVPIHFSIIDKEVVLTYCYATLGLHD